MSSSDGQTYGTSGDDYFNCVVLSERVVLLPRMRFVSGTYRVAAYF